jgi:hypothetical protein
VAAICHRGELSMRVLTRARAAIEAIPIHMEATHIAVIYADGLPTTNINFLSLAALREFAGEMQPREIIYCAAAVS